MKNVCIVGYGAIGPVHASAFDNIETAQLYALCDIDTEKAKICSEKYGVKIYNDFEDMLKDDSIDSVHICTPHYLHYDMIRRVLECKKDVVAEKPVTMTREQFDSLLNIKGSENVCLILQNRFNPCVQKLKEITQSRELGDIKAIKGVLTWHRTKEYYQSASWRGRWDTEGGGVLINQAVHTLDLLVYLAGGIESVKANMFNYSLENDIETEDTFTAYLSFESGVKGLFFATNAYPVNTAPEIEIVYEKGTAKYSYGQLSVNGTAMANDLKPSIGKDYWGSGHAGLLKNYYDKGFFFSPYDAKNTMYTLFAMYESAKENGKNININGGFFYENDI